MYTPYVQKLHDYLMERIEKEIQEMNRQRSEEGKSLISLTSEEKQEIAQNVLNYIHDTEEFKQLVIAEEILLKLKGCSKG